MSGLIILAVIILFLGVVCVSQISGTLTGSLSQSGGQLDATASWMCITFKALFLRRGSREEFSLDVSLAGRLIVFRIDIPVVSFVRRVRGGKPSVKFFRQFEFGTHKAKPVKEGTETLSIGRLIQSAKRIRLYEKIVERHTKWVLSKTKFSNLRLRLVEGTGSPPSTAIVYGLAQGVFENASTFIMRHARVDHRPVVKISACYDKVAFLMDVEGKAAIRAGYFFLYLVRVVLTLWPELRREALRSKPTRRETPSAQTQTQLL